MLVGAPSLAPLLRHFSGGCEHLSFFEHRSWAASETSLRTAVAAASETGQFQMPTVAPEVKWLHSLLLRT